MKIRNNHREHIWSLSRSTIFIQYFILLQNVNPFLKSCHITNTRTFSNKRNRPMCLSLFLVRWKSQNGSFPQLNTPPATWMAAHNVWRLYTSTSMSDGIYLRTKAPSRRRLNLCLLVDSCYLLLFVQDV